VTSGERRRESRRPFLDSRSPISGERLASRSRRAESKPLRLSVSLFYFFSLRVRSLGVNRDVPSLASNQKPRSYDLRIARIGFRAESALEIARTDSPRIRSADTRWFKRAPINYRICTEPVCLRDISPRRFYDQRRVAHRRRVVVRAKKFAGDFNCEF